LGGVHASPVHDSAHKHVSGEARFIDDLPEAAGLVHVALGLSAEAHARIVSVDLTKVAAAPGVVRVFNRRRHSRQERCRQHGAGR